METLLRNEVILSDSEYESAVSRSYPSKLKPSEQNTQLSTQNTCLFTPLDVPRKNNSAVPDGNEKVNKKLRRGTGAPFPSFRSPDGRVDADVEETESDMRQLLHVGEKIRDEVEVRTHKSISAANKGQDLLLQDLKQDSHTEQELSQRPSSAPPFKRNESNPQRPPAEDIINTRHSSHTPLSIHVQDTNEDIKESTQQRPQNTQLTNILSLQPSLTQIRTHLNTLESAISANISAQSLKITGSSEPPVLDYFSLPSFKVEKKNSQTVGAVLGMVKVLCAVERGLEALVGALEVDSQGKGGIDGDGENEGEKEEKSEGGLMGACLAKPEEVALEMQRAIVGMRRVLKMKRRN